MTKPLLTPEQAINKITKVHNTAPEGYTLNCTPVQENTNYYALHFVDEHGCQPKGGTYFLANKTTGKVYIFASSKLDTTSEDIQLIEAGRVLNYTRIKKIKDHLIIA